MSDLIERLRKERSVYDAELCDEAADEIERLREELAFACSEVAELYARNDRSKEQ